MKRKLKEHFLIGHMYKREFRKQLKSFITITLAFSIAFTWRQTTFDVFEAVVRYLTNVERGATSSVLTSLLITFFCIFLIYISSYWLRDIKPTH